MPLVENLGLSQELCRWGHTSGVLKLGLNLNPGSGSLLACVRSGLAMHPLAPHCSLRFYYLWSFRSQKTPGFLSTKGIVLQTVHPESIQLSTHSVQSPPSPVSPPVRGLLGARAPGRRERRTVNLKVSVSFLLGRLAEHWGCQIAKPPEAQEGMQWWEQHLARRSGNTEAVFVTFLITALCASRHYRLCVPVMFGNLHKWILV